MRGLAWALVSLILFLGALVATLPLVSVPASALGIDHLVEMGAWPVVWGALSLIGTLVAARVVFGAWLRVTPAALALAVTGIGQSAAVNVVLQRWELYRFGVTEPEFVGITAGLFAVLVGLAVATFGVLVAPRSAVIWPWLAVVVCSGLATLIVFSNVPGLRDGIELESWWLATCIGASGLYAVGTLALATVRLVRSARPAPR